MMQNLIRSVLQAPRRLSYIRYAPDWLKGYDVSNSEYNGEHHFLREYIQPGMTIFDVGANVGEYSHYILSLNRNIAAIHCFEPVLATYGELTKNLQSVSIAGTQVVANNLGLSDMHRTTLINVYEQHSEWNSLYDDSLGKTGDTKITKQEIVLTTVDTYLSSHKIKSVDLLKLDVEGAELAVLEGARQSLASNAIRCIQFEYNVPFLRSGATLEAVYRLIASYHYSIYRLLPFGKKKIESFSPELENYRYSNWVCLQDS